LRGGRSPWFQPPRGAARVDLTDSIKCDALVVGAGITGSLMAERLTRVGLKVVVIDRELPGRGSTAASTSMLLWELDRSLKELTDIYGYERASRVFLARLDAVNGLKSLVHELGLQCEFRTRDSLYLAAGSSAKELAEDHRLRQRAGLPGEFLDHATLLELFEITRAGAIISPGAADADPIQLAQGLLRTAVCRGARLFKAEAVEFDSASETASALTANGHEIEGGEDSDRAIEPDARDRLIPEKAVVLGQQLAALWPAAGLDIEFSRAFSIAPATECH
jgi:glycine/D-amino acid oxidase-like deaminating enzyme